MAIRLSEYAIQSMSERIPTILLTSLSGKKALYDTVLNQVKMFNPHARLIGADCDINCPAAKKVNNFRLMPSLDYLGKNELTAFLKKLNITHILPTRDGELKYWSQMKHTLKGHGIKVLVSSFSAINFCEDKLRFSQELVNNNLDQIPSYLDSKNLPTRRLVIKEV